MVQAVPVYCCKEQYCRRISVAGGKQKTVCQDYTVEREFLARINVTELISRIIQNHSQILSKEAEVN